jgi:hypothetical protein
MSYFDATPFPHVGADQMKAVPMSGHAAIRG